MSTRSLVLLMTLAALWGGSFVFMRYAVPAMGPVPLTFVRVALAALVLFALAAAGRRMPDLRTRWRDFGIVGLVNSAMPFVLFCFAEQTIGASTAEILNATSPFFGAIAAAIWLGGPLTGRKIGGMALGLAGVALLVGLHPEALTRETVLAIAACLAAALCYGLGGVYAKKRMQGVPSFALACGSQLATAIILAPVMPFTSIPGPVTSWVVFNVVALAGRRLRSRISSTSGSLRISVRRRRSP